MKKNHLFFALFVSLPIFVFAQPQHFTFTANTGDSYSIVVTAATLDGSTLQVGDEIAVFTPDDLCVGASVWTDTPPLALTAWIDDSQTSGVDGYAAGDTMFFRIWQQSSDEEFDAEPNYAQGNGTFGNGAFAQVSLAATSGSQQVLVVTNTNDSGPGSLREALAIGDTLPGPETIVFDIPTTDPGYDTTTGVWTIQPATGYNVPTGTTVDGMVTDGGDTTRPGIELDGTTLAAQGITGLLLSNNVILRGLVINHFQYGIWVQSSNVVIENCYVGTDPTGTEARPNGIDGILLANRAVNALIQNNLLSGNGWNGIRIFGESTHGNSIRNNRIGTNADGTAALPNKGGVRVHAGAHNNVIEENLISGNEGVGIFFLDAGTDSNLVRSNRIGTDASETLSLGNTASGIGLLNGPQHNIIGPNNIVAHNGANGVQVEGADSTTVTLGNTITANSITDNGGKGIYNLHSGNLELAPPTIVSLTANEVAGTAGAGQTVEVFADEDDEGFVYLGATSADVNGNFVLTLSEALPDMPYVTATATDTTGNTSEFSLPINVTSVAENAASTISPRQFSLSQNYPNPFNPETVIRYTVPGDVHVTVKILNILGQEIVTLVDKKQRAGIYSVTWDGRERGGAIVSNGVYFYRIVAGEFSAVRKMLFVK